MRKNVGDDNDFIFNNTPVAIWEEDFTEVKSFLDSIKLPKNTTLEQYLDADTELIGEIGRKFKIKRMNKFALELFETKSLEELQENINLLITPESIEAMKQQFIAIYQNKLQFTIQTLFNTINGSTLNLLLSWSIKSPSHYDRVLTTLVDITPQIKAIKEKEISEERHRSLFEYSPVGIVFINSDRNELKINKKMIEWLGYEEEAILPGAIIDMIHPDDRLKQHKDMMELLEGKTIVSTRRLKCRNGEYKSFQVTGKVLQHGIQTVFTDLTSELEAKQKQRDLEDQLTFLVNNTKMAFWMVDSNNWIRFAQGNLLEEIGISHNKMQGIPLDELKQIKPNFFQPTTDALKGITSSNIIEFKKSFFELYSQPTIDENENITGAISIIRDITDMRLAELQLYQSHKMDAIGRLAGNINHDFNNILMGIMGYTDVILMENDIELIKEDVEEIQKAVIKASSLTAQLSELTRKEDLVRTNFNVVKTMEGMSKLLDRMVDERINFIIDLPLEPCYIHADERKIEQSIMNLVINAKESIIGIGTILLKIRPIELKHYHQTRFSKIPPGKYIKLIVKDDGSGISNEVLSKIFDPFFSTKNGTGLGLSIVFGGVKQAAGAVEVNTEIGIGTEFILYFPMKEMESKQGKDVQKSDEAEWKPKTIFVVDDDSIVLRAVSTMLAYEKNTVFSAVDIDEARLLFDQYKDEIDIVIVDIIMPILNGFQLVDEFKKLRVNLPVIFMTGYSGNHLHEQGISMEDINLLNKPFTKKDLLDKINELT